MSLSRPRREVLLPSIRLLLVLALAAGAAFVTPRSRPGASSLLPPEFVWTEAHDVALDMLAAPKAHGLGLFRFLSAGPRTIDEIVEYQERFDARFAWVTATATLRGLINVGLAVPPGSDPGYPNSWKTVQLTSWGRRVFEAMGEIPPAVVEYDVCWKFVRKYCPHWYYPLPPP